jgi:hypothetical protein
MLTAKDRRRQHDSHTARQISKKNKKKQLALCRWLESLVKQHGITVIVTDDLSSYKIVAEKLQLGYQVCQFHVRRWIGKTIQQLQETVPKEWVWILDEIRELLEFLPPEGVKGYMLFGSKYPVVVPNQARLALERLCDLLLRLRQDWQHYCAFQSEPQFYGSTT